MFNDKYGLTRAVLEGRKTQTRILANISLHQFELLRGLHPKAPKELIQSILDTTSRFKVGEIVAVAQSYQDAGYKCYAYRDTDEFLYFMKDGEDVAIPPIAETNKMYVKPIYMPHQVKMADVRIQRLQDISDEDCLKEGIWKAEDVGFEGETYWYAYLENSQFRTPREAYASLIDKVSGKGTWERNPYVFVYDFELVK